MNVGHGRHPGHAHMAWGGVPAGSGFARGRALPIVVASGLAMGVFAGLVVVRGTGEAEGKTVASAGSQTQEPAATPDPGPSATPDPALTPNPTPVPNPNPGATTGADPGAKPDAPKPGADDEAKPPSMALVTFVGAPHGATILVDGQKIEGTAKEVALDDAGKARVKVQVKASGYKTYAETIDLTGDKKVAVELDRVRKPSSGQAGGKKTGGKKGDGKKGGDGPAGPGGLIKL